MPAEIADLSTAGIRLIATDLDGTLLRSDDTVSDRTRAALRDATAAGLVVAFVTGRPPRWLDDVMDETGHVGVAVGANGAVLYDMADQSLLSVHSLPPELMREIGDELRVQFPDVAFAVEYPHGFAAEPGYVHDWRVNPRLDRHGRPIPEPPMGTLADIASQPGIKLLAKDRSAQPDHFLVAATELLGERATITHSSSYGLLEIAAAGVTKATGLAELAARHDIRREDILAVGDMPNDIPMLEWAGHSFAVANGHASARAAAAVTVGRNDDDAVAELIERVLA
ncbi:HAD family hydrolase [uncultured Jatrophihabitans sp.]|uniref:HAD family hydrolase n=1 Tax=uncultured Jatrophihabitans sp. TaxID=1610747 RepID=UPI0035CAF138